MSRAIVVHKMSKNINRAVCGRWATERTLFAVLRVGRGYRWCKRCADARSVAGKEETK